MLRQINAKSTANTTLGNKRLERFWNSTFLPNVLPLLLGLVLGPVLAILVAREVSPLIFLAIPVLIPVAILLNKYPLGAIMVWMAVMPWFPFSQAYKFVYFTVHRMLIPMALGFLILSRMMKLKEYRRVRIELPELATLGFAVMALISIFVTRMHWKTIFTLEDRFLVPVAAYWLIRLSNAQRSDLRRMIPLMAFLCLAECVIGLLSWFVPQAIPPIWRSALFGHRVTGSFNAAGLYGYTLIFFMVFIYHEAVNREKGPVRTLLVMVFTLGLVCLFFTFTRAVWLAGLLVLIGILFLHPKPTGIFVSSVLVVMIPLSASVLSPEIDYAYDRLHDRGSTENRIILHTAGRKMFLARPIFGWGYEQYDRYDWRFMGRVGNVAPTEWHIKEGTSHHTYLTILAEMGAFGFSLYVLPVLWWLVCTIKVIPRLPKKGFWSRKLLIAMWLPIIAQFSIGQSSDFCYALYALALFWITLGFIGNLVQSQTGNEMGPDLVETPFDGKSDMRTSSWNA